MFNNSYGAFSRRGPASMQIYRNKRKPVCIKKKTILELQHVRRFIVLEDQYGRRDVMWKCFILSSKRCFCDQLTTQKISGFYFLAKLFLNDNELRKFR